VLFRSLTVANSFGCKDSVNGSLNVLALPNVDFTTIPSSFYYTGSPINFIPSISNGILYNWAIDNVTYSVVSPTVSISSTGTHTIVLYLEDTQGCGNTKTKVISVSNFFTDLGILDVRATKDLNNYFTVEADIANLGTSLITKFDISYQITDAGSVKETWNGALNPGSIAPYTFTGRTLS